jgi:hypothetical protein
MAEFPEGRLVRAASLFQYTTGLAESSGFAANYVDKVSSAV